MIAIVNYGLSNLLSISRAVSLYRKDYVITSDPRDVEKADKIILPGVGAFSYGMEQLRALGLYECIKKAADSGIPLLGICLGMQMLLTESEEGGHHEGLNLIEGKVLKIAETDVNGVKQNVPHIGWNSLNTYENEQYRILDGICPGDEVYFVHSYEAFTQKDDEKIAYVEYGGRKINAMIQRGNIVGCQFHPEKSGDVGLKILSNFLI